eukprot:CAMPEP_0182449234 /NCGR_PEP_ID=MMETSP1172-20130603/32647_1 /TAXON_ID=708627 /ORGANISM="Timspurckia oligopyrenoides, Strain CCMP3278" /LENGTH=57 /DNA_ID=CAMNT_0024646415 /DNA_START=364 /DNA_END=537 /DNA_ORIENTATION=-
MKLLIQSEDQEVIQDEEGYESVWKVWDILQVDVVVVANGLRMNWGWWTSGCGGENEW